MHEESMEVNRRVTRMEIDGVRESSSRKEASKNRKSLGDTKTAGRGNN